MSSQLESVVAPPPISIAIETTRLCNLKCAMCTIHGPGAGCNLDKSPKFMDIDQYTDVLRRIQDLAGRVHICPQFQGEPLIDSRILDMIEFAKGLGFAVGFNTNGMLSGLIAGATPAGTRRRA